MAKRERYSSPVVVSLVTATLSVLTAVASASDRPVWQIELQPMYMWVDGDDMSVASRTRREDQGASYGPLSEGGDLDVDIDPDFAFRAEASRMGTEWGFGVEGWWFDSNDSTSARPQSDGTGNAAFDPPGATLLGVSVPSLRSVTTTSFVSNPAPGVFEDTSLSELRFDAKIKLEVWTADVFGIRELLEEANRRYDLLFGIKLASLDSTRKETVTDLVDRIADPMVSKDRYALRHKGKADYGTFVGPMLGLSGHQRWNQRHRIEGLITQSLVFGDVDRDSRITETQEALLTAGGSALVSRTQLANVSDSDDEAVPITEIKLQYLYDVNKNIALGVGGFLSVWWDAPLASASANKREETLTFLGLMLTAELVFD